MHVELRFLVLKDRTLVGSAIFVINLKLSCGFIFRYIVLCFYPKKPLLLPTKCKIRGLVICQDDAMFHSLVPTSLYYLPSNLYTSVVDFIYVCRLVESALYPNSQMYSSNPF